MVRCSIMSMKHVRHLSWLLTNLYARIFARSWLAPVHRALITLSLHGLGYDNCAFPNNSGETWFIRHVLTKHDVRVCLDVGANIGNYTRTLLSNLDCTVYAFEPSSSSYTALTKHMHAFTPRVVCVQTAVANFDGQATLFSPNDCSEVASLDAKVLRKESLPQNTPVTTLDTFTASHQLDRIDFIKIDTEGFEWEVLEGAATLVQTLQPKFIQFEFNVLHLRRDCTLLSITALLPKYTFYRLLPRGWMRIDPAKAVNNVFMYSNIIAVHNTVSV